MNRPVSFILLAACILLPITSQAARGSANKMIGINVVLRGDVTDSILADLGSIGRVRTILYEIDALTMQIRERDLQRVRNLPYVAAANPDAERKGVPIDTVGASDFTDGMTSWDMDAINVMDTVVNEDDETIDVRQVSETGEGVYVAVLDSGLVDIWRRFFPQERIAEEYALSLGGGGGEVGRVSSQPNKWEHDQNSHGTHVTSTILGYALGSAPIAGVAPMSRVIPVKVLNQNGAGWSSVVAEGIVYIANLKMGPLADNPVVINMSLGGPELDAMEKAALDLAIESGVIVVAAAGNEGEDGMSYPGAYAPVISVAATGWNQQWTESRWWLNLDVPEGGVENYYIADFSSRELEEQELDVAAPGSWVVGPYKLDSGNALTYYYLGGTSMATPHVAGVAALMLEKNPTLNQAMVEEYLKSSAIPIPAGCMEVMEPTGAVEYCWEDDATGSGFVTADAALAATPAAP